MITNFDTDIENALPVLRNGGIILYPTDTIWGVGCDALNEAAVAKIFALKKRDASKSLIIFLADSRDIMQYVADPDPAVFDYIETLTAPTTIVFQNAIGLPQNVVAADGSVGIRIVQDPFCRHLLKRLRRPLVSTSANISGTTSPNFFSELAPEVLTKVDYVVRWRQSDTQIAKPSRVVKWNIGGMPTVLRP